jgi:hypothetical protein
MSIGAWMPAGPFAAFIVAAGAVGTLALIIAYLMGGAAWNRWLARTMTTAGHEMPSSVPRLFRSGFWFELLVFALTVALALYIADVTQKVADWPWLSGRRGLVSAGFALVVAVAAVVSFVGGRAFVVGLKREGRETAEYRAQFRRGYWAYPVFSGINVGLYVASAALILAQVAVVDRAAIAVDGQKLADGLRTIGTGSKDVARTLVEVELVNHRLGEMVHGMIGQVNTVLLLVLCALIIAMAIATTWARFTYLDRSVSAMWWPVAIGIVFVLMAGWYVYYFEYSRVIETTLARLREFEGLFAASGSSDFLAAKRYSEIIADWRGKQGLSGFVLAIAAERGGVVALLLVLRALYQRVQTKPVAKAGPV